MMVDWYEFTQCFVMSRMKPYRYILCCVLLQSFDKKRPWRDLIRVDLIRFSGSIPEAMQDGEQLTYSNYTRGKCTNLN